MTIEWKNPPDPTPTKAMEVMAELRTKPGEWARIAKDVDWSIFGWWLPLAREENYQVKVILADPTRPLGKRDVYATFLPK